VSNNIISADRIKRRLKEVNKIGKTKDGGVTCHAYSKKEKEAFDYITEEIPESYQISVDTVGNLFATPDPDADNSLYLGSHLDSVRNGGKLDGKLGVITALEAIQAVEQSDEEPPIPPTLAVFRGEETARFDVGLIGSRSAVGLIKNEQLNAKDKSGTSLQEAIISSGFNPPEVGAPTIDLDRVGGFIELHIEQGPILDSEDIPVGIVDKVRGPLRDEVEVTGRYNHSGATPMDERRDALAGAAKMVTAVETIGKNRAKNKDIVTTVGDLKAPNASANKISGKVRFTIDYRSTDKSYRKDTVNKIRKKIEDISENRDLKVDIRQMEQIDPVELNQEMVNFLENSTREGEIEFKILPSGGGHDVMSFSNVGIPAGLVFTSCKKGLSHNPNEETSTQAMIDGTKTLAKAILNYDI
jgi:hydantoinase/carbamoylase family amidase